MFGDQNRVYAYANLVEAALAKAHPAFRYFRCVTTGWDNTPRRRRHATVVTGSTPALYRAWLEGALQRSVDQQDSFVFVNAWNEWAEGAHLEPDKRSGRAYLEATREALRSPARAVETHPAAGGRSTAVTKPRPKLTVCIPTCNGARFLAESIQSVLGQSFGDFELLIVDDASDDDSRGVSGSFSDPRVRLFSNASRLGLVGNWNRCLDLARGEYICIFHQDDVMEPDNVSSKVAFLDEHPSAGFVYSSVLQVDAGGEVISGWWYFEPRPEQEGLHSGADFFRTLVTGPNIVSCPSVLVRRACYERIGKFSHSLPFTADWELWMRAALFFDVGYLVAPLVRYRRHDAQETGRFSGVSELQHGYLGKMLVLSQRRDRIPDAGKVAAAVRRHYRDAAFDHWRQHRLAGRPDEAATFLAFALDVNGTAPGESADDSPEWIAALSETVSPDCAASYHRRELAGDLPPVRAEFLEIRREMQRAIDEIAALRRSLSWRITAPLRTCYELALRMRTRR